MFILNPYDRYLQTSNNGSSGATNPLNDLTNSHSRRLVESITRSRKASPVVTVTIASANSLSPRDGEKMTRVGTSGQLTRNCIPFPSAPVSIPSRAQTRSPPTSEDSLICVESSCTPSTDWIDTHQQPQPSITKAQFRSRLTENSCLLFGKPEGRPRHVSGGHELKKILESAQYRKICRKERSIERRRTKKTGKVFADVKFLAALHRSIVWCIECAEDSAGDVNTKGSNTKSEHILNNQDRLLAQRLLIQLVARGQDPSAPLQSASSTLLPSSDLGYSGSAFEDSAAVPCISPPFTRSSIPSSPVCPPASDTQSTRTPPGVLAMPQVVASLILRHKNRTFTARPRTSPFPFHRSRQTLASKSPLSKMYLADAS